MGVEALLKMSSIGGGCDEDRLLPELEREMGSGMWSMGVPARRGESNVGFGDRERCREGDPGAAIMVGGRVLRSNVW